MILKHYFYLTPFAWLTSPDCAEALVKKKEKKNKIKSERMVLPAWWRCRQRTARSLSVSHIMTQEGLYWLFSFPANGIDPPKVSLYILLNSGPNSTMLVCAAES